MTAKLVLYMFVGMELQKRNAILPSFDVPLFSTFADAAEPEPWKLIQEYLRTAVLILKMPVSKMQRNLSQLPVPEKYDASTWGPPRQVSAGTLSSWLHGREPMPGYRLAGATALLEIHCLEWGVKLEDDNPADQFMKKRIALAVEHIQLIAKDPTLGLWLTCYRLNIYRKLRKDRTKSKALRNLFDAYRGAMPTEMLDEIARTDGQ